MKTTLIIIILLISATWCNAQTPTLSPGDHLIKGGRQIKNGLLTQIGSAALGSMMILASDDSTAHTAGFVMIGIGSVIGLICEISGAGHIIKAGRMMNEKKIGIVFNGNGVGIRMRIGG